MSLRTPLSLVALALSLLACGGSASETPWPVPPQAAALGPAGEAAGPTDLDDASGAGDEREEPSRSRDDGAPRDPSNPLGMRR